jgi:hypothetical protein
MIPNLKLNRLAIHYVDRNMEGPIYAPHEQDIEALHPTIIKFIIDLVSEVWDAPDTGSTRSGRFVQGDHKRLEPLVAKQYLGKIIQGDSGFFTASKDLALHLHQRSHPRASPGVLAVTRLVQIDNEDVFVAVLKIRHKDESFVRVVSEALTQLEVEQVENMLLRDIQKGAVIPHPHRDDYDLKVIDKQAADDPAKYFTEDFLGCLTKKSDEHQVKSLLPELQRYARDRGLPLTTEKLPQVVVGLQERVADITTSVVTEVVQEKAIFGADFQPEDFKTYIERESDLGPVDIPRERFARSGKRADYPRDFVYRFRDPELRGVVLSGPPEALDRILTVEGDVFTFRIQTTKDGFSVHYR